MDKNLNNNTLPKKKIKISYQKLFKNHIIVINYFANMILCVGFTYLNPIIAPYLYTQFGIGK